jgi:hypothetical protein
VRTVWSSCVIVFHLGHLGSSCFVVLHRVSSCQLVSSCDVTPLYFCPLSSTFKLSECFRMLSSFVSQGAACCTNGFWRPQTSLGMGKCW